MSVAAMSFQLMDPFVPNLDVLIEVIGLFIESWGTITKYSSEFWICF